MKEFDAPESKRTMVRLELTSKATMVLEETLAALRPVGAPLGVMT